MLIYKLVNLIYYIVVEGIKNKKKGETDMTLQELRKESCILQYGIAKHLGITRQQYHNIETGRAPLNSEKIKKLSEIFNVDAIKILEAWEESKNAKRCWS